MYQQELKLNNSLPVPTGSYPVSLVIGWMALPLSVILIGGFFIMDEAG